MPSRPGKSLFSFDFSGPLGWGVIQTRVWLPGFLTPPRGEPGDYVGDFVVRHTPARLVSPPIRRSQLRAPRDDTRAPLLTAEDRQNRIIRDRAAFASASTAWPLARLTAGLRWYCDS